MIQIYLCLRNFVGLAARTPLCVCEPHGHAIFRPSVRAHPELQPSAAAARPAGRGQDGLLGRPAPKPQRQLRWAPLHGEHEGAGRERGPHVLLVLGVNLWSRAEQSGGNLNRVRYNEIGQRDSFASKISITIPVIISLRTKTPHYSNLSFFLFTLC